MNSTKLRLTGKERADGFLPGGVSHRSFTARLAHMALRCVQDDKVFGNCGENPTECWFYTSIYW